jgi:hypothetical protein
MWSWVLQDLDPGVTELARSRSNCTSTLKTYLLIREDTPQWKNCKCPAVIKIWSWAPRWVPDTKTDWPTNHRSKHNFNSFNDSSSVEFSIWRDHLLQRHREAQSGVNHFSESSSCVWVGRELLWLRPGDSSVTKTKGNVCHWTPLREHWWRHSW